LATITPGTTSPLIDALTNGFRTPVVSTKHVTRLDPVHFGTRAEASRREDMVLADRVKAVGLMFHDLAWPDSMQITLYPTPPRGSARL
jgi:hypothetical protein